MNKYIPSNGTEGMQFVDSFCSQCMSEKFMHTQNHDDKQCEIFNNSLLNNRPCYNKDLKFDGWEWFRNDDYTKTECKQYKHWDWGKNDDDGNNDPPEEPPYDPTQLLMFSFDEQVDNLIKERKVEVV